MIDLVHRAWDACGDPHIRLYLSLGWIAYLVGLGVWIVLQEARAGGHPQLAAGAGRAALCRPGGLPAVRPAADPAPPAASRACAGAGGEVPTLDDPMPASWRGWARPPPACRRAPRAGRTCWWTGRRPTKPCWRRCAAPATMSTSSTTSHPDQAAPPCATRWWNAPRRGEGTPAAGCGRQQQGPAALLRPAGGRRRTRVVPPIASGACGTLVDEPARTHRRSWWWMERSASPAASTSPTTRTTGCADAYRDPAPAPRRRVVAILQLVFVDVWAYATDDRSVLASQPDPRRSPASEDPIPRAGAHLRPRFGLGGDPAGCTSPAIPRRAIGSGWSRPISCPARRR